MQPPAGDEGDLGRGAPRGAVDPQLDLAHLERDERGRAEPAVDVRLVAGDVGAVDGGGVRDDGVGHGRHGQQRRRGFRRAVAVHRGVRARRARAAREDEPLGEPEAVLHRALEVLLHGCCGSETEEEEEQETGRRWELMAAGDSWTSGGSVFGVV